MGARGRIGRYKFQRAKNDKRSFFAELQSSRTVAFAPRDGLLLRPRLPGKKLELYGFTLEDKTAITNSVLSATNTFSNICPSIIRCMAYTSLACV